MEMDKTELAKIKSFFDKKFYYAVIGASQNPQKYGNIVLKNLYDDGYNLIPINPNYTHIMGIECYPSLDDVETKIDVAIFIIPPNNAFKLRDSLLKNNINKVWMQPGSESEEMKLFCRNHKIDYIQDACIMVTKSLI